jgi:hypothetical protein
MLAYHIVWVLVQELQNVLAYLGQEGEGRGVVVVEREVPDLRVCECMCHVRVCTCVRVCVCV